MTNYMLTKIYENSDRLKYPPENLISPKEFTAGHMPLAIHSTYCTMGGRI